MQTKTKTTAFLVEEMTERINASEKASNEALLVFGDISKLYQETMQKADRIVNATQEQTTEIQQTVDVMRNVVVIAEQTAAGTEEVAASAQLLSDGMDTYAAQSKQVLDIVNALHDRMSSFTLDADQSSMQEPDRHSA